MRRSTWMAAMVLGAGLLAMPASADLPPSLNPLRFSVSLNSDAGFFYQMSPLLDETTGKGTLTMSEADLFAAPPAGVELDLDVDVNSDPEIAYTLTLRNGSAADLDLSVFVSSPMQPFDEAFDGKHTLTVTAVDVNGGGVMVDPNLLDFTSQVSSFQEAFANGVDFLNPPFARTGGPFLGDGPLLSTSVGAGETSRTSGPQPVDPPGLDGFTPDGKYNNASIRAGFVLSAGDTVTLVGKMTIAKGLGGGGATEFQPVSGTLAGKQQLKAKKIATIKNKDFSQQVSFGAATFSFRDGDTTVGGAAEVKKKGKLIKLSLDAAGKEQLRQLIVGLLSGAAGDTVTVALTKEPKGKGSVKKDGAKSKFTFSAKYTATLGDVTKKGTYKVTLKGALALDM